MNGQHLFIEIGQNYEQSYADAFSMIIKDFDVSVFVSGDIFLNDAQKAQNFVSKILSEINQDLVTPLSQYSAPEIFQLMVQFEIKAIITCVATPFDSLADFLGGPITFGVIKLAGLMDDFQFDLCGEKGEYHTTVVAFGALTFTSLNFEDFQKIYAESIWSLNLPSHIQLLDNNN